ncbi:thioredoxin family protein [Mucilaginibacter sp.]|uniref:thioredoxin family protein n=1 Tax=Mucilaginibacter sp. TaxID=1882438 RepID=UPI003AFFB129
MNKKLQLNLLSLSWLIFFLNLPLIGKSQINTKPAAQINFVKSSWAQALKKAKEEHKYVFVDAYATWCAPCRQMKETTFKNKEVAAFFNKNFINLAIDAEKGEGIELAEKWGLESYPTVYILNSKGVIISTKEGLTDAADMIRFGKSALVN